MLSALISPWLYTLTKKSTVSPGMIVPVVVNILVKAKSIQADSTIIGQQSPASQLPLSAVKK